MASNDWTIVYQKGAICRTIMWNGKEVALVNPAGDFTDETEADLAAGLCFAGKMHALLRKIDRDMKAGGILESTYQEVAPLLRAVESVDTGVYEEVE